MSNHLNQWQWLYVLMNYKKMKINVNFWKSFEIHNFTFYHSFEADDDHYVLLWEEFSFLYSHKHWFGFVQTQKANNCRLYQIYINIFCLIRIWNQWIWNKTYVSQMRKQKSLLSVHNIAFFFFRSFMSNIPHTNSYTKCISTK